MSAKKSEILRNWCFSVCVLVAGMVSAKVSVEEQPACGRYVNSVTLRVAFVSSHVHRRGCHSK